MNHGFRIMPDNEEIIQVHLIIWDNKTKKGKEE